MVDKTLYIHIGSHKTGTTAIQSFFALNRDLLRSKGFLYPGNENAHHDILWELRSTNDIDGFLGQNSKTREILQEIKKSSCNTIVVSSEELSGLFRVTKVKQVIDNILGTSVAVKIIYYCRRQDHLIQSVYQQKVKAEKEQLGKPISTFIEEDREYLDHWDHYNKITRWSEQFGKENIIVRVYEKEQLYKNDLIMDFLHIIGIDFSEEFRLPTPEQSNIGLGQDAVELLRICNNAMTVDPQFKKFLKNSMEKMNQRDIFKPYSLLSPEERIHIIRLFDENNKKLAREYLDRNDGALFYEPLPDPDEPWERNEGLTVEKIVPLFAQVLFTMDCNFRNRLDILQGKEDKNSNDGT